LAHKRPRCCAGKGLLTEAGLKSPIFYSEDFAIDGAAMLEKLSAMQMESHRLKECLSTVPIGVERILVEDQVRAAGQVSHRRFAKDPAGIAAPACRQAGGKDFVYVKSAPASIENHQWKSARRLDAIVSSKSRLVKAPPSRARAGSFARIVESRPDALRSSS